MKNYFEIGDSFIPTRPKEDEFPWWVKSMDLFDGKTLVVEDISPEGCLYSAGWNFNTSWCKKVEK